MNKKRILFIILTVFILAISIGTSVLASGWYGPNSYSTSEDYSGPWGEVTLYPHNYWYEYWDDSVSRYTQYKIKDNSYCQIYVDSSSSAQIKNEYVQIVDSDWNEWAYTWYDWVYPDDYWFEYYPESDITSTKPANAEDDPTYIKWMFTWNYIVFPYTNPIAGIDFFFRTRTFQTFGP